MLKKYSFWAGLALLAAIGFMISIHWSAQQSTYQRTAAFTVLSKRHQVIDSMYLSLEKYRRLSGSFRKFSPDEIESAKERLRRDFSKGSETLDQLDPQPQEKTNSRQVRDQLTELLSESARIEPTLFSRDAYVKPEIQKIQDRILGSLDTMRKSTDDRISSLELNPPELNSKSMLLLFIMGGVVLLLFVSILFRNYVICLRPLKRLHQYAEDLRKNPQSSQVFVTSDNSAVFSGAFYEIQKTLNTLAGSLQTHIKDRHKFIQDIVIDLKGPLSLLQSGKYLLTGSKDESSEEEKQHAADSVMRGLSLISGSLSDLEDIVNLNQLESRLEDKVVDISDMIGDLSRTFLGSEASQRIKLTVPPMPVWVRLDAPRFERMLIQVYSKIFETLPPQADLAIMVSQPLQGNWRGVQITLQHAEKLKSGRPIPNGPEQDLLKHWISEKGLSMALVHKIIKAHHGNITVAGIMGSSISVTIRLPQERVVENGLISRPADKPKDLQRDESRGLKTQLTKNEPESGSLPIR